MTRILPLLLAVACAPTTHQRQQPGASGKTSTYHPSGTKGQDQPQLGAELFPAKVGGFAFGATEAQFKADCEQGGGAVLTDEAGACSQPAVPLPAQVHLVGVNFCSDRLCEFRLMTTQVERWVAVLEDKYGKAHGEGSPQTCKNDLDRGRSLRLVWFFGTKGTPTGILRVIRDCNEAGELVSSVTYENAMRLRTRAQQDRERRKNY